MSTVSGGDMFGSYTNYSLIVKTFHKKRHLVGGQQKFIPKGKQLILFCFQTSGFTTSRNGEGHRQDDARRLCPIRYG